MKMIKWVKPNGTFVESNDLPATVEAAVSLGWKPANTAKAKKPAAKKPAAKK